VSKTRVGVEYLGYTMVNSAWSCGH